MTRLYNSGEVEAVKINDLYTQTYENNLKRNILKYQTIMLQDGEEN